MFTITGILTALAGLAASVGPLVLAGGPLGIGLAWLGSMAGNKTIKLMAIIVGGLLVIGTTVAVTVHIQHLERDSAAYNILSKRDASLEVRYGCGARPAHEQDLSSCLTARERDAEVAKVEEIARQRDEAAREQAKLDRENAALDADRQANDHAIVADAATGDGPVPPVLLNAWRRARTDRGLK